MGGGIHRIGIVTGFWLRGQDLACTEPLTFSVLRTRPTGYEADQKENIGPQYFNHLRANSLISLHYLAALNRSRRKGQCPKTVNEVGRQVDLLLTRKARNPQALDPQKVLRLSEKFTEFNVST